MDPAHPFSWCDGREGVLAGLSGDPTEGVLLRRLPVLCLIPPGPFGVPLGVRGDETAGDDGADIRAVTSTNT